MQWTKMREKFAAVFAVVIVIVAFAGLAVAMGWNIPIIRDISEALGIGQP